MTSLPNSYLIGELLDPYAHHPHIVKELAREVIRLRAEREPVSSPITSHDQPTEGVTSMSTDASAGDAPAKLTPTQRLHEVTLAALTRTPVKTHESVEVSRDGKGYRYNVSGIAGEGESLEQCATRVFAIVGVLDSQLEFPEPEPDVDLSRNAKGDAQYSVKGSPKQAARLAAEFDEKFPLSRKQAFDRDFLPAEK